MGNLKIGARRGDLFHIRGSNSDTLIFSGSFHLRVVELNALRSLLSFISNESMCGVVIVDHRQ